MDWDIVVWGLLLGMAGIIWIAFTARHGSR
jgi:hypothetical protein